MLQKCCYPEPGAGVAAYSLNVKVKNGRLGLRKNFFSVPLERGPQGDKEDDAGPTCSGGHTGGTGTPYCPPPRSEPRSRPDAACKAGTDVLQEGLPGP